MYGCVVLCGYDVVSKREFGLGTLVVLGYLMVGEVHYGVCDV